MAILGIFHQGSGLGNQLHRYVGSKVLALDDGQEHGMVAPELFKGASFMDLDMDMKFLPLPYTIEYPSGKVIPQPIHDGIEIVDGEFQSEKDWKHRAKEVNEWLKVEPLDMPDDLCVIGFRGGEYKIFPELYLPKEYWKEAMDIMYRKNPDMRFEVHTDDAIEAKNFFPDLKCIHNIGTNWRSVRYAKNLIVANSSFYILPAWLNRWENGTEVIAPKFWARHNKGYWSLPENEYEGWTYI